MGAQREILIANNKLRPIALKRVKRQLITCATRGSANARVARKEILLAGNKKRQIAHLLAHRCRFLNGKLLHPYQCKTCKQVSKGCKQQEFADCNATCNKKTILEFI